MTKVVLVAQASPLAMGQAEEVFPLLGLLSEFLKKGACLEGEGGISGR